MPTGTLKKWLGDKGFGFITADDGSADLFAHIRQKAGVIDEPITEGRRVRYEYELDMQRGKPKAVSWSFLDAMGPVVVAAPPQHGGMCAGLGALSANFTPLINSPRAASVTPAMQAPAGGVDYQALAQAANVAAAALSCNGAQEGQPMGSVGNPGGMLANLMGSLAGMGTAQQAPNMAAGGAGALSVMAQRTIPAPPPPVRHAQEEVEVPAQFVEQVIGQAGGGLDEIKRRAGGDILIELTTTNSSALTRTLKIRGPPVSASLGACLVLQRLSEVVV